MVAKAIAVLLVLSSTAASARGDEPQGIRLRWDRSLVAAKDGARADRFVLLSWGVTQDEMRLRLGDEKVDGTRTRGGAFCSTSGTTQGVSHCMPQTWVVDFGDARVDMSTFLHFYRDRFYGYLVTFDTDGDYNFVRNTLVSALGKPTGSTTEALQNRMGASFRSEVTTWAKPTVLVQLRERAGSIDKGSMTVTHLPLAPGKEAEEVKGVAPF